MTQTVDAVCDGAVLQEEVNGAHRPFPPFPPTDRLSIQTCTVIPSYGIDTAHSSAGRPCRASSSRASLCR